MSHMQQFVIFYDYILKACCKQEFLQAHSDGSIKRLLTEEILPLFNNTED